MQAAGGHWPSRSTSVTREMVAVSQITISPLPKASASVKTTHGKKVCDEISNDNIGIICMDIINVKLNTSCQ